MDAAAEQDFAAFVASRSPALFRTAMALTGHRQQAEDLLQVALAKSVRHWPKIRHGRPEAYVRTTMYRQHATWWRSRRRGHEFSTAELPELVQPDSTGAVDQALVVAAALNALAPKSRAALVLRYLEDMPTDEIAEILRVSPATVRSQISRALARLRELCPELAAPEMYQTQETQT